MRKPNFSTDAATRRRMQSVRRQNTQIEKTVRSILHKNGFRFRLRNRTLAGKPDIILRKYCTVIFVHGCFWHGHESCDKGRRRPLRNAELWQNKISYNIAKDERNIAELDTLGWKVLVVWECQTKNDEQLGNWLATEILLDERGDYRTAGS